MWNCVFECMCTLFLGCVCVCVCVCVCMVLNVCNYGLLHCSSACMWCAIKLDWSILLSFMHEQLACYDLTVKKAHTVTNIIVQHDHVRQTNSCFLHTQHICHEFWWNYICECYTSLCIQWEIVLLWDFGDIFSQCCPQNASAQMKYISLDSRCDTRWYGFLYQCRGHDVPSCIINYDIIDYQLWLHHGQWPTVLLLNESHHIFKAPPGSLPCQIYNFSVTATPVGATYTGDVVV